MQYVDRPDVYDLVDYSATFLQLNNCMRFLIIKSKYSSHKNKITENITASVVYKLHPLTCIDVSTLLIVASSVRHHSSSSE